MTRWLVRQIPQLELRVADLEREDHLLSQRRWDMPSEAAKRKAKIADAKVRLMRVRAIAEKARA